MSTRTLRGWSQPSPTRFLSFFLVLLFVSRNVGALRQFTFSNIASSPSQDYNEVSGLDSIGKAMNPVYTDSRFHESKRSTDKATDRPPREDYPAVARWLVHQTNWGVLSTLDKSGGFPVGGVVSHADGPHADAATTAAAGEAAARNHRLFFYLSPWDENTKNALANPDCSYTISEMQTLAGAKSSDNKRSSGTEGEYRGGYKDKNRGDRVLQEMGDSDGQSACASVDPENPTCAKISILGQLLPVNSADVEVAAAALFSRHPEMKTWPKGHMFGFFELKVREIHLLDWYGGMKFVTADQYYGSA